MQLDFFFQLAILIVSVMIHEISHGYVAYALGDPTAKLAGRLTLNPLKHMELFGSFLLPVLLAISGGPVFGWAKPVPYNPYNLQLRSWGPALVAAAGPLANFLVAFCFALVFRFAPTLGLSTVSLQLVAAVIFINIFLALFNLIPVPPLDGSKVLFSILPYRLKAIEDVLERFQLVLLLVVVFLLAQYLLPVASLVFHIFTGA